MCQWRRNYFFSGGVKHKKPHHFNYIFIIALYEQSIQTIKIFIMLLTHKYKKKPIMFIIGNILIFRFYYGSIDCIILNMAELKDYSQRKFAMVCVCKTETPHAGV